MTRTLGGALATDLAQPAAEKTELIALDFADLSNNPTPVYLTTAARDLTWDGKTWQAVGGHLDVDALGETTDNQGGGLRVRLSGVDQAILALILGARWRGRGATVYYAHLNPATGAVIDTPVQMFGGQMNGGFQIAESRGDFGGGAVDITTRLTSKLNELVRVRGVRCNVESHRATVPAAATAGDTFFQHVAQLPMRKIYWGTKAPSDFAQSGPPNGDPRQTPPTPWGGPRPDANPWGNPGIPSTPQPPASDPWGLTGRGSVGGG